MMRRIAILLGVLALFAVSVFPPAPSQANCVVTGDETFVAGTYVPDDKCGVSGGKKMEISGGVVGASATATAASPSYTDGYTNAALSVDLAGNLRTTMSTLLSCEDQTNFLCMVSGGAARQLHVLTNVSTNTTSATFLLPVFKKSGTFQLVCNAGASTNCGITITLYGNFQNTTTNAQLIGSTVLPTGLGTTIGTIPKFDEDYAYYFIVTTGVAGTSPVLNGYYHF